MPAIKISDPNFAYLGETWLGEFWPNIGVAWPHVPGPREKEVLVIYILELNGVVI